MSQVSSERQFLNNLKRLRRGENNLDLSKNRYSGKENEKRKVYSYLAGAYWGFYAMKYT